MIKEPLNESIENLLVGSAFFFLIFFVTTIFAQTRGFFSLPFKRYSGVFPSTTDLFFIFIFFSLSFFGCGFVLYTLFSKGVFILPLIRGITPLFPFVLFLLLTLLYRFFHPKFTIKGLIKDPLFPGKKPINKDILNGFITLILSFPPLYALFYLFDAWFRWMNYTAPMGQNAVNFLIQAKQNPLTLSVAIVSIVIGAPLVEEFIFRGVFQSFFRKKKGAVASIFITSLFFSFFHFSVVQGIENLSILANLFLLSLYLGFVYEKTRSLYAPITLHVTFNLINVIKILLYGY
jgi:hypothetical protein